MKRLGWRLAVVVALALSVVPFTAAPASAAPTVPTAPTGVACTVTELHPEYCAAVRVIEGAWVVLKMGEVTGIEFATFLDAMGGQESMFGVLGSGGVIDPESVGLCVSGQPCAADNLLKERAKSFLLRAAQAAKEAEKAAALCESLGWWLECAPDPLPNESFFAQGPIPTWEGFATTVPAGAWTGWTSGLPLGGGVFITVPVPDHSLFVGGSSFTMTMAQWGLDGDNPDIKWVRVNVTWQRGAGITSGPWTSASTSIEARCQWCGSDAGNTGATSMTTTSLDADAKTLGLGFRISHRVTTGLPNYRETLWKQIGDDGQAATNQSNSFQWTPADLLGHLWVNTGVSYLGGSEVFIQGWNSISEADLIAHGAALVETEEVQGRANPIIPRPGTEEQPTPTTELAPATTAVPAVPTSLVPEAPPSGTHEERQTGLLENLVNGVAGGFNWLGNFLGGLLRSIVDMIRWLGDIFGYWIRWLWERLGGLLRAIRDAINSLGDLMERLLGSLIDGVRGLGDLLWEIAVGIWNLPGLIGEAILSGLHTLLDLLFVPEAMPSFAPCGETFPCNWVEEVTGVLGQLQADASDLGGCVAPAIGWTEFSVSFPPPPGCSGGNVGAAGANDDVAGDLFGYRTTIRTVLMLALWFGFIRKMLGLAPWSREGDMPISEGAVL